MFGVKGSTELPVDPCKLKDLSCRVLEQDISFWFPDIISSIDYKVLLLRNSSSRSIVVPL